MAFYTGWYLMPQNDGCPLNPFVGFKDGMAACGAFYKESRMKLVDSTAPYRKSGGWGTRRLVALPVSDIKPGLVAIAAAAGERMTEKCKAPKQVF
jgi:hypothetical protein